MSYKNNAKFWINENGLIEKTEDSLFLVSGADNESAVNVYVSQEIGSDLVVYGSFKRADGFAITNRSLILLGATEDEKYYEFVYLFNSTDRILDIAGQLEVSFTIAVGNKKVATVSNCLLVRRNVQPNLETKTEEEFYEEAIEIVERTQQELNAHKLDFNNPHKVRADQTPLNSDTNKTVEERLEELVEKTNKNNIVYGTNESGEQTQYNVGNDPNNIPIRNEQGQIIGVTPTLPQHVTNKGYVDTKIEETKEDIELDTAVKILSAKAEAIAEATRLHVEQETKIEETNEQLGSKLAKNFATYTKKNNVDGSDVLPILSGGTNQYVEVDTIVQKIQSVIVDMNNSIVTFVYNNYQDFLSKVQTTYENGITTLVSITSEDDSITLLARQIALGFQVLLRDENIPDYWLSRKSVESEYAIDLFTPFETKLNLEDYALKTDLKYTNSKPTTASLGGIAKGTTFDNKDVKEVLDMLLYPYVAFSASISTSPNGGTYELGTTQNVSTATVSITMGSEDITSIKVLDSGNNVLAEKTSDIGTSNTFTINRTVSSDTNFKAVVTDGTTSKTPTSGSFTFVSPYYYGAIGDVELTEALIKGLTKSVSSKGTKTFTITMNQQKAVIAYPSSYGNLTRILDENSFNVTETFVKNTLTIDNVSYYVYVLNAPATSTMKYTFSY